MHHAFGMDRRQHLEQGLDIGGFARIGDLWSGALVGRTVNVRFWRISAADIPRERQARIDWLYDQWERIDGWIGAQQAGSAATPREA